MKEKCLDLGRSEAVKRGTPHFLKKIQIFIFSDFSWKEKSREECLKSSSWKKKKKYFLKNSETRLPKREQPLSLLLAQWHPWGSQPMLRQSSASLGTENKCWELFFLQQHQGSGSTAFISYFASCLLGFTHVGRQPFVRRTCRAAHSGGPDVTRAFPWPRAVAQVSPVPSLGAGCCRRESCDHADQGCKETLQTWSYWWQG